MVAVDGKEAGRAQCKGSEFDQGTEEVKAARVMCAAPEPYFSHERSSFLRFCGIFVVFVDFAVDCCGCHVSLCLVVSSPDHPVSLGPRSESAASRVVSSNSSFSSLFPSRPRPCVCLHPHRYHYPIHHVVIFMPLVSAHPSRALWPPIGSSTERLRGRGRMAAAPSIRHTPRPCRGPMGGSSESPRGTVRAAAAFNFGAPLTRFAAP